MTRAEAAGPTASEEREIREQLRLQEKWDRAEAESPRLDEYLAHRGLRPCSALRLSPREVYYDDDRNDLGSFPAILARIQSVGGETVALHRTFLDPSGPGKLTSIDGLDVRARKITKAIFEGATRGSAIRLSMPKDGDALAIAEGIETALAVHEATGIAAWAAVSAGGVASIQIPDSVHVVEIYCDHDKSRTGEMAAQKAAKRLRSEGRNEPLPEKLAAVEHVSVSVARALEVMQSPKNGLLTPFAAINHLIVGGFQPGELAYLGARPGVGKTAIALEIARHGAKKGKRVLIVSREMLAVSLARRMLSQEGQLSAKKLKLGAIDMSEVAHVAERLSQLPIWITDSTRTLTHVAEAIDGVPNGIDLLIVDYLQLMNAPKEIRERRLQVESVSQGLKALALARQIPIVCLSSLVRPMQGANPEPTLASLRESGELEHDADIVMFLHRPQPELDEVLCIVAKNRDGETGRARLIFKAEWVAFCAAEMRYAEEDSARWGGR